MGRSKTFSSRFSKSTINVFRSTVSSHTIKLQHLKCNILHRLSERNCIEIINLLIQKKLIDLIFTTDGKEYITPAQLVQDIKGELYASGGRINLVDVAKAIGVDLAHINAHINDVLKSQNDIHFVLGQLIDNCYIFKVASEINEKLQQQGQINVNDLTVQYDLPAEFLQQCILEKQLGKIIQGKQDKNDAKVFFTESFVARSKAKIRGALAGLTRPTAVTVILNQIGLSEKLFFGLFDQVALYGCLSSRSTGAQYIPNIYSRSQNDWVNSFYKQNGYLEYEALIRLGINDYKTYLKKQLAGEQIFHLNSCVVSKRIIEQIEADVEECIVSKSYVDLQNSLPSVFNEDDLKEVLKIVLNKQKQQQTLVIDSYVLSKLFVENLINSCDVLIKEKAKDVVESGKYQQYITSLQVPTKKQFDVVEVSKTDKREERRKKAAGGKSGGGHQGRETKTKSTKKSNRAARVVQSDEDDDDTAKKVVSLEILNETDVKEAIENQLDEEELTEALVEYLLATLNEKALQEAGNIYAVTIADRTSSRRQTHNELQNKLNTLIGDVRLFEKGIKALPTESQPTLYKYLLKTLCTEITNEILKYLAAEQGNEISCDNLTNEQRLKIINEQLPIEIKPPLQNLIKSLTSQNLDDFMINVEESLTACSMIIKKIDKKKDRLIVLNHKHSLLEELNKCDDPALVLHLAVLIIFVTVTQNMLHASGRHISTILVFLKQFMKEEDYAQMSSFHGKFVVFFALFL